MPARHMPLHDTQQFATHFCISTGGSSVPRCGQVDASGRGWANTRYTKDPANVTCRKCKAAMGIEKIPKRTPQQVAEANYTRYLDYMRSAAARGDVNVGCVVNASVATLKMDEGARSAAKLEMLRLLQATSLVEPPKWRAVHLRNELLALAVDAIETLNGMAGAGKFELNRVCRRLVETAETKRPRR